MAFSAFKISVVGDVIAVVAPYSPALVSALRAVPGAEWSKAARRWEFPAEPDVAVALDNLFRTVVERDPAYDALMKSSVRVPVVQKVPDEELCRPARFVRTPMRRSQIHELNRIRLQHHRFLAWRMGAGKTLVGCAAIAELDDVDLVLVVCPGAVCSNWPAQYSEHIDTSVRPVQWCVLGGEGAPAGSAARALALDSALQRRRPDRPFCVVINTEGVWRKAVADVLMRHRWSMVIVDESHKIKDAGGQASKFMARLGLRARRRVCMSGTPFGNSILDVFGQFKFLDPAVFGASLAAFRARYAIMGGFEQREIVGVRNAEELRDLFLSRASVIDTRDVVDLPPVTRVVRPCPIPQEVRKLYVKYRKDLYAEFGGRVFEAKNSLSMLVRLQQITSGYLPEPDGSGRLVRLHNAKGEALSEWLDELPEREPVVVFYTFVEDAAMIREVARSAGRFCFELRGGVNQLAEWKAASGGEVLAVQMQAGSAGIDLTRACYCAWVSAGYSYIANDQSEGRTDRPGQTRPVTHVRFVVPHTIDIAAVNTIDRARDSNLAMLRTGGSEVDSFAADVLKAEGDIWAEVDSAAPL